MCVCLVDAGSITGSERSSSSCLFDAGAQSTRPAESSRSGRPAVRLHRSHDELHPTSKNTAVKSHQYSVRITN